MADYLIIAGLVGYILYQKLSKKSNGRNKKEIIHLAIAYTVVSFTIVCLLYTIINGGIIAIKYGTLIVPNDVFNSLPWYDAISIVLDGVICVFSIIIFVIYAVFCFITVYNHLKGTRSV